MAERVVPLDDIRQKEGELERLEDSFRLRQKDYIKLEEQLSTRNAVLNQVIDSERDKMRQSLARLSLEPIEAADFFKELDDLSFQSNNEFSRQQQNIVEEKEQLAKDYQRSKETAENELHLLRRQYASTDE